MKREGSQRRREESEDDRIIVDYETHSYPVFISHRDKESNDTIPT